MRTINKVFGLKLEKGFTTTERGTLIVRGIFTSDNIDEVGDLITREATEKAVGKYREWGNIRLMHQPKPVGRCLRIGSADGLAWNEIEFEVIDPEAVFMVANGLLTALSVGILVDLDSATPLPNGGMCINEYVLAEISLVDHPANYDAKLKDLPVDQGLNYLIQEHGFEVVAKTMTSILDKEILIMDEEKTIVEGTEEISVDENDKGVEVEEAIVPESPAEAVDEVPAEDEDVEDAPAEEEEESFDIQAELQSIKDVLGRITDALQTLIEDAAAKIAEVAVEDSQAQEQPVDDAEKAAEIEDEDAGLPASRKGLVVESDSAPIEPTTVKNLKKSLENYFSRNL